MGGLKGVGRAAVMVAVLVGAASAQTGTFTDKRDGQTYKTVKIGKQTWMAQNLNYKTGNSWCYKDEESKCRQYGRLYDWNTAKTACPSGWHLPSRQEWGDMVAAAGGDMAGKKLKSAYGWNENGNGSDDFGFSGLPGGDRGYDGGFGAVGYCGRWWTATDYGSGLAYGRGMDYYDDGVDEYGGGKSGAGFSARCVAD